MKSISLIVFVAVVIQLTLSAPSSETYETPLGPMDLQQLVDHFLEYRYHKYDEGVQYAVDFVKVIQQKLDEFIAKPGNTDADNTMFEVLKVNFVDFLKDVENADLVKECSLLQIVLHHAKVLDNWDQIAENDDVSELNSYVTNKLSNGPDFKKDRSIYEYIRDNNDLHKEVKKLAKFDTVCCKFWDKSYHKDMIKGECGH